MTKLYNLITLLDLNLLFWCTTYYPKHIVEISANGVAFAGVIFNLLFFSIYFSFFFFYVAKNKSLFVQKSVSVQESENRKSFFVRLFLFLVIQIIFEIIHFSTYNVFGTWIYVYEDVLLIVWWLLFFNLLTYKRNNVSLSSKKKLCYVFAFGLAFVIVAVFCDVANSIKTAEIIDKYVLGSPIQLMLYNNVVFNHSLVYLFLDMILGSIFVFAVSDVEKVSQKDRKVKQNSYMKFRRFCIFLLRCVILWFLWCLLCVFGGVKKYIYPNNSVNQIDFIGGNSRTYIDHNFSEHRRGTIITRFNNVGIEQTSFEKETATLSWYNKTNEEFESVDGFKMNIDNNSINFENDENNELKRANDFKEYVVDGNTAFLYRNSAICYFENNEPIVVKLEDVRDTNENAVVSEMLKNMLLEGNVLAFEHGADYLLKYENSFILSFIKRYKNGEFNEHEEMYLEELQYNKEYIIKLAKSV